MLLDLLTTSHDTEWVIKEDSKINFVLVAFSLKHTFVYADPYVLPDAKWAWKHFLLTGGGGGVGVREERGEVESGCQSKWYTVGSGG
jgi:hypothetical protein